MFAFFTRMIRDKFKLFLIYSLTAIGLLEMYVALFPTLQKNAVQFDAVMKTFPPEMFKAMNMDPASLSMGNFESYLSSEFMSFLWPILAIVFAISLANYICINEVDKGTIEALISLPAKRIKIFIQRYFAGLLLLFCFCLISIFAVIPLAEIHNINYVFANYKVAAVGLMLFIWVVYSTATFVSVIFSEKGKSSLTVGGILVLMYVFNIISALNSQLVNLKYFSIFYYFNGSELLGKGAYTEHIFIALGGVALAMVILSVIVFRKRDLAI